MILRIYFDGQKNLAVNIPLWDFFCNADNREYRQISSLHICYHPRKGMNCYFELNYFKEFRMEVENISPDTAHIYCQIDCKEKVIDPKSPYFYAQFRRINPLPYKEVRTIFYR